MKPVFKIPLTISLFIFLVSLSTVAKAQLAIGIGTSAYYNRLYDRTGFPLTLVGEFDQSEKVKFLFMMSYGPETVDKLSDDGWRYISDYRPLEFVASYRYFFVGDTDEGFGFFWALGGTFKLNMGSYKVKPESAFYSQPGIQAPEFPDSRKMPLSYLNIGPGYKFDLDPININLGFFGELPFQLIKQIGDPTAEKAVCTKLFLTVTYRLPEK